jgi:hypothetical protein
VPRERNRDFFPIPNASGFNTVTHSRTYKEPTRNEKYFTKRVESNADESIETTPSLISVRKLEDSKDEFDPAMLDQVKELKLRNEKLEDEKRQLDERLKKA